MKEFIKSLMLIALTFSAIIMTKSLFIDQAKIVDKEEFVYQTADLIPYIRPQNYIFSFGDLFIKLYDDDYENYNLKKGYDDALISFFSTPTEFTISRSSKDIWEEQSQRKSLKVVYPFSIDLGDLLTLYDFNTKMIGEIADVHVSEIIFLLNKKESLYLYDNERDEYYRLFYNPINVEDLSQEELILVQSSTWIDEMYEYVNVNKTLDSSYKTVEGRYNFLKAGLKKYDITTPNNLLIPMSNNISYTTYNIIKEINFGQHTDEQLENYARNIFGDNLSFVKKSVFSDLSTIFMYGYGDVSFEVNQDGSLVYTSKAKPGTAKKAVNFHEGLAKSIEQVNKMGVPLGSLYLSNYEQIENANNIETIYSFNTTHNGIPFFNPELRSGGVAEVRFVNADLTRVRKDARIIPSQYIIDEPYGKSFINIMERNRIEFENQYLIDRPDTIVEASDFFQMTLQEMTQLDLVYYVKEDMLIPVWHIVIANTHYFIDLTSGLILETNQ